MLYWLPPSGGKPASERSQAGAGAFLVATPATSVTALLVCYSLLGIKFTVFIFFAVIVMGLVMGFIGNLMRVKPRAFASQNEQLAIDPVCGMNVEIGKALQTQYGGQVYYFCSPHCQQAFESKPQEYLGTYSKNIAHRLKQVLKYAFDETGETKMDVSHIFVTSTTM